MSKKRIAILGTRGIPASYGGFETFAEALSLYLAARDWNVTVYCQNAQIKTTKSEIWNGIRLLQIPSHRQGKWGSIIFDLNAALHLCRDRQQLALVLGYNTAIFNTLHRILRIPLIINMDGIEWKRCKWSLPVRGWFWMNEWIGAKLGKLLIADHPEIKRHLSRHTRPEKIETIAYGAPLIEDSDFRYLEERYGLESGRYGVVIARPEPENNILTIVRAFSQSRRSDIKLVVLGNLDPQHNKYHKQIMDTADSNRVLFPGAIYDPDIVRPLRHHARYYVHGHSVGGTNPSLVEALGAQNAIIAHDNPFNRWVIGEEGLFFTTGFELLQHIERLNGDDGLVEAQRALSRQRHSEEFTWEKILRDYERVFARMWEKR